MTGIDRRTLLGVSAALGLAASSRALAATVPPGFERVPLWPGAAPGAEGVRVVEEEVKRSPTSADDDTAFVHTVRPTLSLHRPARPNGGALLLIPGGGYRRVAIGHEGYAIARRFADLGYFCAVLVYRLPADGWAAGPDAPLQDAQRAMRLVRARAAAERFAPEKVGTIGFSAGGHLAARLANEAARATYVAIDAADVLLARPLVSGLLYPVIQMAGERVHPGSRDELLGRAPTPAQLTRYGADAGVTAATPPTFLASAIDDRTVPVDNSIAMLGALRAAAVPAEMHLFEAGGHGFGLTLPDKTASPWPELFVRWAQRHGMP